LFSVFSAQLRRVELRVFSTKAKIFSVVNSRGGVEKNNQGASYGFVDYFTASEYISCEKNNM
jgi:hypothetical protein